MMSGLELTIRLLAGVVLVFVNAFFVAVEFAMTRLRQVSEEEVRAKFSDYPGLARAWEMTNELEIYLTGCQLGITLSTIVLGVVTEPAFTKAIRPIFEWMGLGTSNVEVVSVVVAVFFINLVHKIWGEQAPTYLGVERPLQVAGYCAPLLWGWSKVMQPFIYLGDGLAKWTLRLFGVEMTRSWTEAEEGEDGEDVAKSAHTVPEVREALLRTLSKSELPEDRREEVLNALEIDEVVAREIMIPREEVVALDGADPFEQNRQILKECGFTRYPLVDGGLDALTGVIYVPSITGHFDDLATGKVTFEELAHEPVWVDAETSVANLIDRLQREQQEVAIIHEDDTRQPIGIVTITDAFEAIFGGVEDPLDVQAA